MIVFSSVQEWNTLIYRTLWTGVRFEHQLPHSVCSPIVYAALGTELGPQPKFWRTFAAVARAVVAETASGTEAGTEVEPATATEVEPAAATTTRTEAGTPPNTVESATADAAAEPTRQPTQPTIRQPPSHRHAGAPLFVCALGATFDHVGLAQVAWSVPIFQSYP
jgi:hypothetical protein